MPWVTNEQVRLEQTRKIENKLLAIAPQLRFDLSIAQVQRVLELDQKFTSGYLYLGDCYEAQLNYLAAIEAYEKTADLWLEKDRARVNAIFQALREAYNTGGERD